MYGMQDTIAVIDKVFQVVGNQTFDMTRISCLSVLLPMIYTTRPQLAVNRLSNSTGISMWHKHIHLHMLSYTSYCLILCISLSPVSYASHENVQQKWFNKLSNNSSSNLTGYRIGVCGELVRFDGFAISLSCCCCCCCGCRCCNFCQMRVARCNETFQACQTN